MLDRWAIAQTFPPKEEVYPDHAALFAFDACNGKRVLEYGCGGGSDTESYLTRGAIVDFCDVVPGNVEATMVRVDGPGGEYRGFLVAPGEGLNFAKDGEYDRVSCDGVLHHIEDPDPIMAEFNRVLKPGGELVIMLYTRELEESFQYEIRRHMKRGLTYGQAFCMCTDCVPNYARSYSFAEGVEFLDKHGFSLEKYDSYNKDLFGVYRARK